MDSEAATSGETSKLRLSVKFGGRSIPVEIAADATIKDLKLILQTLTDVLPRGQKLIFKGKVMSDESTLASADISDRSKIMLMASQGIHQGGGPMKKELPTSRAARGIATEKRKNNEEIVTMSRLERWKLSGVIALSDCGLTTVPEEAWTCGSLARVLDVSHNSLLEVPAEICRLSIIQKLLLNGNLLSDTSIAWDELTSLKHLIVLSLNQNNLASVPPALGALTSLKQLHIANNKLVCIPTEIGLLTDLEVLKAQNNRLKTIPTSIGNCISLVEVDLSCNLLSELPETFGNLRKLKALYLSNNGLKTLPKTLFRLCLQLSILDLHGTEITIDLLRQFEGWESFDERRRLKHQKQLDFRVDGSGDFDEGADKNW
ncbi:LRR repeats and ubiquitin-like domain-containing protein At2g30105 [Salvia miltiorrhiza]|uniref:LRR repeats and ubiquitin-like domain-containing protein At2g30105 n=1 Tax=Salvia miltiorrhiza TaxID=226208 RepID=UPI0025AC942E|nr:LRR repeats and ubiquitin-like domain-containing protein At2g30105 [Salvia miltiorrhiza]